MRNFKFLIFLFLFPYLLIAQQDKISLLREKASYPLHNWRFILGDPTSSSLEGYVFIDISRDWKFQTDPKNIGLKEKWFSPSFDDSKWAKIDCGRPWEEQGYPDYDGIAWYRKLISVPKEWMGKPLFIIFGGVDDEYDLFVNGEKIAHYGSKATGSVHESTTFTDISRYVKYGDKNLIALRVNDWGVWGGPRKPPIIITPEKRVLNRLGIGFLSELDYDDSSWQIADIGFSWNVPESHGWFRKIITVPDNLNGFPVAGKPLYFRVGIDDEGEIYVDGKLAQSFRWADGNVKLRDKAVPGEKILVVVRAINHPGQGRFMFAYLQTEEQKELEDLLNALDRLQDAKGWDKANSLRYEEIYNSALQNIDEKALQEGNISLFRQSLAKATALLKEADSLLKRFADYIIPQSHIDAAWLWRWPETVEVCRSTFLQALDIMDKVPTYTFTQSAAQYYLWMQEKYPEIFKRIKQRVKEGRWGVVGGMWVESDLNMPNGEALVRQFLYGKRYFLSALGVDVKVGWSPDTFGHSWQLPQILKKSGIDYYFHYRCSRGPLYWWEGIDGSRVLVRTGEGGLNDMKNRYDLNCNMYLIGPGDHGGGATLKDVEEIVERSKTLVAPKMVFATPETFYKQVEKEGKDIPVVKEELNFEFEGCYTSQAKQKYNNRKSEYAMLNTELLSTIANYLGIPYPKKDIEENWHLVLFNQFHDLLPGSGIHAIYEDAQKQYNEVFAFTRKTINSALSSIAENISTQGEGIPLIVFNPLSWERTDIAMCDVLAPVGTKNLEIYDFQGNKVNSQILDSTKTPEGERIKIAFLAERIPGWGYKLFYAKPSNIAPTYISRSDFTIDNKFYSGEIDPKSGNIARLYDKRAQREIFSAPANVLQVLGEGPGGMSAWVIHLDGNKWELNDSAYVIRKDGPLFTSFYTLHRFSNSSFDREIRFYKDIPRIDIIFNANWQEHNRLLKVAFPTTLTSTRAFFEIPYAVIERPSDGRKLPSGTFTPPPDGGHEVPALTFANIDSIDGSYGVAILNDCKYGYDVKNGNIRLTLLRGSVDPDPQADMGYHKASYAIYPHQGNWQEAEVLKRGWEFNNPLIVFQTMNHEGELPPQWGFLKVEGGAIATAIKLAEDSNSLIIRLVEFNGRKAKATITFPSPISSAYETNLLERRITQLPFNDNQVTVNLSPYEIKTLEIALKEK
jgi:alpha-mannosidase